MDFKFSSGDFPPNPIIKDGYTINFDDEFDGDVLDGDKWIPYYLPQWSSRERSKPNYHFADGCLVLKITDDQKPWCPEFNGDVKCSSIQTGVYAGKLGTSEGQHRFNPECLVREEQENRKTYVDQYGYFEIRAKALSTPSNVVALWMIGYEDKPERCAEICIFEIKGGNVSQEKAVVGYGIHAFNDPDLEEAFYEDMFNLDVTSFHIYAAEWTPDGVTFYIDNQKIRTVLQSPAYPMQFMLNIYEVPVDGTKSGADIVYPKEFVIDYVRSYKKVENTVR